MPNDDIDMRPDPGTPLSVLAFPSTDTVSSYVELRVDTDEDMPYHVVHVMRIKYATLEEATDRLRYMKLTGPPNSRFLTMEEVEEWEKL